METCKCCESLKWKISKNVKNTRSLFIMYNGKLLVVINDKRKWTIPTIVDGTSYDIIKNLGLNINAKDCFDIYNYKTNHFINLYSLKTDPGELNIEHIKSNSKDIMGIKWIEIECCKKIYNKCSITKIMKFVVKKYIEK